MLGQRIAKLPFHTVPLPPKTADAAYVDPRHATWASAVKKRAGYRCEKCGVTGKRMYADHIKELRDGGERFSLSNGRCLCASCHQVKTIIERAKRWNTRPSAT